MPRVAQPKVAIVAALEREVWPLVRRWASSEREHEGRKFKFFENEHAVLVCGGIGAEAARRATEAVITLYRPEMVQSVGFAGALDPEWKVGAILVPSVVIDAQDGSRVETGTGCGALVSIAAIASIEQKRKLAKAYGAQAVDMEASAVARGAQVRGIGFSAVKVIYDEIDFELPSMKQLVGSDGQFKTGKFVAFVAIRPWLWPRVIRLRKNSADSAKSLCLWLGQRSRIQLSSQGLEKIEKVESSEPEAHPIPGARV